MLDTTVSGNHTFTLIKTIYKCYSKVQLYQLGKTTTEMATKNKVERNSSNLSCVNTSTILHNHNKNTTRPFVAENIEKPIKKPRYVS